MEEKSDAPAIDVAPLKKVENESGVYVHPDGSRLLYQPDEDFEARMCCGQITSCDKGLCEFLAKSLVSFSVLGFCFLQLSQGLQSEFASSTISLILGTYLGSQGVVAAPPKKNAGS